MQLTADVTRAFAINDRYRNWNTAEGADLWTLEQLPSHQYTFPVPTFIPVGWSSSVPVVTQDEYIARFFASCPELEGLLPLDGIVVAGGAAAFPLTGSSLWQPHDVDLFLVGKYTAEQRWSKMQQIVLHFRGIVSNDHLETLSKGVLTLHLGKPLKTIRKIQLVLREFPTLSALLHGFDVPSCCVAFDGVRTVLTYLGAYAHVYHVNLVHPAYRSPTYEQRLAKYFSRMFALGLPSLDLQHVTPRAQLVLPFLTLHLGDRVSGTCFSGTVVVTRPPAWHNYDRKLDQYHNLVEIARGGNELMIRRAQVPLVPLKIEDCLPVQSLMHDLRQCVRNCWKHNCLNVRLLQDVFRFTPDEIALLVRQLAALRIDKIGYRLTIERVLQRAVEQLRTNYTLVQEHVVEWWYVDTQTTGRFTTSLYPEALDTSDWYGTYYTSAKKISNAKQVAGILGAWHTLTLDTQACHRSICGLCHEMVSTNEPNTLRLGCNHCFHWSAVEEGCVGLESWVTEHRTCPLCRRSFSHTPEKPTLHHRSTTPSYAL